MIHQSIIHSMNTTPAIRQAFWYTDVQEIVEQELESGTDELKERVRLAVISKMGLTDNTIPERVRGWIHQLCLTHTAGIAHTGFSWKSSLPIDLASLPNR